jgi:hypothetical protein
MVDDDAEAIVPVKAREDVVERGRLTGDGDREVMAAQNGGVHWWSLQPEIFSSRARRSIVSGSECR